MVSGFRSQQAVDNKQKQTLEPVMFGHCPIFTFFSIKKAPVSMINFVVLDYGSESALASRTQNQACVQGRV